MEGACHLPARHPRRAHRRGLRGTRREGYDLQAAPARGRVKRCETRLRLYVRDCATGRRCAFLSPAPALPGGRMNLRLHALTMMSYDIMYMVESGDGVESGAQQTRTVPYPQVVLHVVLRSVFDGTSNFPCGLCVYIMYPQQNKHGLGLCTPFTDHATTTIVLSCLACVRPSGTSRTHRPLDARHTPHI